MEKSLFADIVVKAPSDPKIRYFTYRVPKDIAKEVTIGQVVLVPFGKKEVKGWIINITKKTSVSNLKDLKKILSPLPLLLPNYIKLLKWISSYYYAPISDCLAAMLPDLGKRELDSFAGKEKNRINEVNQELIIIPSINHLDKIPPALTITSKDIVMYHHQLSRKEKFEAWEKIYFGEAKRIIGLRSAIFVPCHNLKLIRIIDEEDPAYFEERSPYYNLLAVAEKLCQISGAKLILESKTPRVETFYKTTKIAKEKKATIIELKTSDNDKSKMTKCQIIDMSEEIRSGNKTAISNILRYNLIENFKKKRKSLLFLNRLKESGQVFCQECKYSGYLSKPPDVCPNCQGVYFKFYSLNLEKIDRLVKSFLPNAKIQFLTSETQPNIQPADVTLATSAIFYSPILTPFFLVGIISADTILNLPDFRSGERTFTMISRLINLADRNGQVIIQTYNPHHPAVKLAAMQDYQSFYQNELKERKALGYPPFSIFAKLSISQKKEELAKRKAMKLYNRLIAQSEQSKKVEIFPPSPPILPQKACYNIILKTKRRIWLDPFLELVPSEWKVEIEPKELV